MSTYTEGCKRDGIKRTFGVWLFIFSDREKQVKTKVEVVKEINDAFNKGIENLKSTF